MFTRDDLIATRDRLTSEGQDVGLVNVVIDCLAGAPKLDVATVLETLTNKKNAAAFSESPATNTLLTVAATACDMAHGKKDDIGEFERLFSTYEEFGGFVGPPQASGSRSAAMSLDRRQLAEQAAEQIVDKFFKRVKK